MADEITPRLNLVKPEVGGSADTWGDKWNENADKIDAMVVRQSDLGTAATRDVTTSKTDTTEGRLLKVGDFGVGEPIILTSSDDLNDIMSPGIYSHSLGNAPANTPVVYAGMLTVFIGDPSNFVVQVWRRREGQAREFQRTFDPNSGVWTDWVEFYNTGNLPRPLGVGQTWQDVTSSRAAFTTYTNTTGRPIFVAVREGLPPPGSTSDLKLYVDGKVVSFFAVAAAGSGTEIHNAITVSGIVPPGSTYRIEYTLSGAKGVSDWMELR